MKHDIMLNHIGDAFTDNAIYDGFVGNTIGFLCNSSSFGYYCMYNQIGDETASIYMGHECCGNRIGHRCDHISLGDKCQGNEIGQSCLDIDMDAESSYNRIGHTSHEIDLAGVHCKIGNDCSLITVFGSANEIGDKCLEIIIKSGSTKNRVGRLCENVVIFQNSHSNRIGNDCLNILIGDACYYNEIGDACEFIHFCSVNSEKPLGNYRHIKVESGTEYLGLVRVSSNDSLALQNVTVHKGLIGEGDFPFRDKLLGKECEINIMRDSQGSVVAMVGPDTIAF